MAAPQVAGGFALIKQKYPNASVDQLFAYIRDNGVTVRDTGNNNTTKIRFFMDGVKFTRTRTSSKTYLE
jgi:hypothetical protein